MLDVIPNVTARVDEVRQGCHPGYCFLYELLTKIKGDQVPHDFSCSGNGHCNLKEMAISEFRDGKDRILAQHKCIEIFRYEYGQFLERPVSWEEASEKWVKEGFASTFASAYRPCRSVREIYRQVRRENFATDWQQ